MNTFKQYLNKLEKQRKSEKTGVFPNYVHGSHATEKKTNTGVFPSYVHGKHASNKINEDSGPRSLQVIGPRDYRELSPNKTNSFEDWSRKTYDEETLDKIHATLDKHYDDNLRDHRNIEDINSYTQGSFNFNNQLIRAHRNGVDKLESESYEKRKHRLDEILTHAEAPEHITTFSGLGFDPRKHMNENNELHSPAYISSSINPRVANSFAVHLSKETGEKSNAFDFDEKEHENHILKIDVPRGSKIGAYVDRFSNFGGGVMGGEVEFLHRRGQTYNINPTPEIYKKDNITTHVWSATPKKTTFDT
jgi:hypothetical protein